MKLYLWVLPLAMLLQGCFIDAGTETESDDSDDDISEVDEQEAGDLITSLDITVSSYSGETAGYPVATRVEMRGALSAEYELRVNGDLVEDGTLPSSGVVIAPALGTTTDDNYRVTYVTLGSAGDHEIELTLTKDGVTESRAFTRTVSNQCTGLNENWYVEKLQSTFGSCTGCHTSPPDNGSFADLSEWIYIENYEGEYHVAHWQAGFDETPEDGFAAPSHQTDGGGAWSSSSDTHHRVIEMLYRMDTDFTCS